MVHEGRGKVVNRKETGEGGWSAERRGEEAGGHQREQG